jgi:pyruvate dehydrogenase E1 component alpha subunit
MFEKMQLIRSFEEASIKAYQQKKIAGFLHTYIGHEAVGVGTLEHKLPQDSVVTTYRCHGLYLAMGGDPKAGMAELFGKVTGCARGKGGSMHFFSKELNFLGGHGIVGGQFGVGIGAAFKSNYENDNGVSFIFFGDGAQPQGTFHECMNLAALWNLPAIFICEDNQYGMGTANRRAVANTDIASKAAAYGVKGYTINGMDLNEVHETMRHVVNEARTKRRPALVHMKTYRFFGHSVSDAGLYLWARTISKLASPCTPSASTPAQLGWSPTIRSACSTIRPRSPRSFRTSAIAWSILCLRVLQRLLSSMRW